jgi:hypothetical protein
VQISDTIGESFASYSNIQHPKVYKVVFFLVVQLVLQRLTAALKSQRVITNFAFLLPFDLHTMLSVTLLLVSISFVHALPSFLDPVQGTTLQGEMQCYSLPYGGIGFISHLITYYTLVCLWVGRRPPIPWKELNWSKWDCALGIVALILSVGIAIFTIVRCRNRWQFVLLAVWKTFMSAMLGLTTITTAVYTSPSEESRRLRQNRFENENYSDGWVLLYLPGLIIGYVGLFSLVKEAWDNLVVRLITYVMWGVAGALALLLGLSCSYCIWTEDHPEDRRRSRAVGASVLTVLALIGITGALYSDWVLGAMAGNYSGIPSGDIAALYWIYFIAKRLPLGAL